MTIAILSTGRHDIACAEAIKAHLPDAIVLRDWIGPCATDLDVGDACMAVFRGLSITLAINKPVPLMVIGDRSEVLAACVAATVLKTPIIHVRGGETTTGAIDNVCRHAISQLASIHFVAHEPAASKLRYMGVGGPIHVVGDPALDILIAKKVKHTPGKDIVLVYHPTTLGTMHPLAEIEAVVEGVRPHVGGRVIMCGANPDAGGAVINDYLRSLGPQWVFRPAMPPGEWRPLQPLYWPKPHKGHQTHDQPANALPDALLC